MRCDAFAYTCDCGNEAQVKEVALKVQEEIGKIDILVNNAGIMNAKSITMQTEEQIRKTFDTNVLSHFWVRKNMMMYYSVYLFVSCFYSKTLQPFADTFS